MRRSLIRNGKHRVIPAVVFLGALLSPGCRHSARPALSHPVRAVAPKGAGDDTVPRVAHGPERGEPGRSAATETPSATTDPFLAAWPSIQSTVRSRKADSLVAPELGLVVLAPFSLFATSVARYKDFSAAFAEPTPPFSGVPNLDFCDLVEAAPPEYDCVSLDADAPSCIYSASPYLAIAARYESLFEDPNVDKSDFSETDKAAYDEREGLITASVTDTSAAVAWYFGIVDDRWRLIALRRLDYCPYPTLQR